MINKKNIKKFLIIYHNKLKLYKLNKYNYYFINLLLSLYNFNYKNPKAISNNIFENNILYKINITSIKNIFYIKKYSLKILLPINFTLKINIWYFILYNKYIIYLSRYLYNLILKLNYINIRYPLLLLLIRYIFSNRLNKIKKLNENKYSDKLFKYKYRLIFKKNKNLNTIVIQKIQNIKFIIKKKIFKLFILLSNNNIFTYISHIWLKSSKIDVLYNNYSNIIYNINLNEINKFNILGLYSLYWQTFRYGFNYEYYFYNTNLYKIINKNNVKLYNIIYCKFILLTKNILIIWYKIKNLILLNYINKNFYKYNNKFKLNKYNKYIYRKYLTRILTNYVFKFKSIKVNTYYNIKNHIRLIKKNLDYICNSYLFNIKYNQLYSYNISISHIIDNMIIDFKINSNINLFKNLNLFLLTKIIGKYIFINWLNIINNIINFKYKLINRQKKNVTINFNNYILVRNKSYKNYFELYKLYNFKYIWIFEKSIIYNIYILYINLYYKLLLLMNITKKLL